MTLSIITSSLGATNGASQSALDVILACKQSFDNINVIYKNSSKLPQSLDDYSLNNISIYKTPKYMTFPIGEMKIKLFRKWLDSKLFDVIRKNNLLKIKSKFVLVNGISGHDIFLLTNQSAFNYKIIIVRESPRHFKYKFSEPQALENAINKFSNYNYYIFVSNNILNEWKNILSLKDDQCYYIPNCIQEKKVKKILNLNKYTIKRKFNFSENHFNVVCVASLQYRKGQDIIIDCIPDIVKNIPQFHLHLVGPKFEPYTNSIINHKYYKQFNNHIKIWGSRKDTYEMIYAADLMILPTRAEALPRVILEAMALNTPILSTNVDGISEMVQDNVSAILFHPEDKSKMVRGMITLFSDKILLNKLVRKASQDYWEKFSRKSQVLKYQDFFKKLY